MALPTFVAAGTDVNVVSSGGTTNVPTPAGTALDDFIFLVVEGGNAASNTITASGFTPIDSIAAGSFQSGLYLYYRWATASEPGTYPVQQSGGNVGRARMYAWRGVNKTGTINASTKSTAQNGVTTISINNITTTVSDCLEIGVSYEYNGRTPTISAVGQTSRDGSTAGGLCFLVTEKGFPTAGAISGETHSSSISGDFFSFSIALAPASGGGGDTTPPTLTSPTGSATGSTTGSGSVVTDEANGTLYFLATTNATETAATVKASGGTQAISSTGTKTVSFSGLSPSTVYYAHYVHRDAAGNDSTRVSSSSFTTSAGGGGGTIVGDAIKNPSGTVLATTTIPKVVYKRISDMVDVLSLTSQTTDGSGLLPVTNAALVAGVDYLRILCDATGANVGIKKFTAT